MTTLKNNLGEYLVSEGMMENDNYIGIPVKYGVFYDKSNMPKKGYGGTPIMIYVINTNINRIGTLSDSVIINGMIDRGYIVTVLDYLGNDCAVSPALDWSVQGIRRRIMQGELFADTELLGPGSYPETLVVPSGYDVSYSNVFWQFDKHGSDGSFDAIVNIWNNDFRGTNGEKLIKWTSIDGKRKQTRRCSNGTDPIWCDKNGAESVDGEYIKIKYTVARDITDCVKPDGSPIDLKLYMHLIYPTKPVSKVPVMCLSGSSESLCAGSATPDRPHLNGFLFNGYAGVLFDYGYTPMARNDHYGYFDGYPKAGYVTGDNATYSMKHYNDFSDTAAMRYIRYLALSDERFCFDTNAIGVYGNSKGAWMSHLGEKDPCAMPPRRIMPHHHGETRYENGDIQDRGIIKGGEEQPWLTYNGKAIPSGASFIYSGCGATYFAISKGHGPMFVSCNRRDESCFSTSNAMVNLGRIYNIPTMWLEIPLPHTLVYDKDLLYGVDSYKAFFDFAGYYLKKDSVKVVGARVDRSTFPATVTVMFSGTVAFSEGQKIAVFDSDGNVVKGRLESSYGGIEWTFTPDKVVYGSGYKLCVPADIAGDNGKACGNDFVFEFDFPKGEVVPVNSTLNVEEKGDRRYVAFEVLNNGSNRIGAYTADGKCIGIVNTFGKGWYKIDVTTIGAVASDALVLKCERECTDIITDLKPTISANAIPGDFSAPDGVRALGVNGFRTVTKHPTEEFYAYPSQAISCSGILDDCVVSDADVGRRFEISFKVFDTSSRYVGFGLNHCSHRPSGLADYRRSIFNELTLQGKWVEYKFDYVVYEPTLGEVGRHKKTLYVNCFGKGEADSPIYFADFKCREIVSDVEIGDPLIVYEYGECARPLGVSDIECPKSPWSK